MWVMGQVWYLIVSIHDLCLLTYFSSQLKAQLIWLIMCNFGDMNSTGFVNADPRLILKL